jgi:hypothetical protein
MEVDPMNSFMIIIKSDNPSREFAEFDRSIHAMVREQGGEDCQAMQNTWFVRSSAGLDTWYDFVFQHVDRNVDRFMVVPVEGSWRGDRCLSYEDCQRMERG